MGTKSVYIDAHNLLRINISRNMIPFFKHKHLFAARLHLMCKYRAKQTGTCDQIIIMHLFSPKNYFALYFLICTKSSISPRILSRPS